MEIRFQKIVRANLLMQRITKILNLFMVVALTKKGQKSFGSDALFVVKTKWMMMIQKVLLIRYYRIYVYLMS